MKKSAIRWMSLTALCAALAACGGGGGDGGSNGGGGGGDGMPRAATGDFNAGTYAATANAVSQTVLDGAETTQGMGSLLPLSATGQASHGLPNVQQIAANKLFKRTRFEQPQATESESMPCDTGSLTYTYEYRDVNNINVGDSVTIASNSCVLGGEALSGSVKATITRYSESQTGFSGGFSMSFSSFGSNEQRFNGAVNLSLSESSSGASFRAEYRGLSYTSEGVTAGWYHTVAFAMDATSTRLSVGGFTQVNNAFYRLEQRTPFTWGAYPSAGELVISDAQGDWVRITATQNNFVYDYFNADNKTGTPNATVTGLVYAPQ